MKCKSLFFAFCFALQVGLSPCQAHDNLTVHPKISEGAVKSSSGLSQFLGEGFGYGIDGTNLPSFSDPEGSKKELTPIEWVKNGSVCEDIWAARGKNHFYDPVHYDANHQHIGLTDGLDDWGQPSFKWATVSYYDAWPLHDKSYSWPEARGYELNALTNSSKLGRDTNLARMFFYLGHVLHLNQDLSVPAHVRNDNHMISGTVTHTMWTEKYGTEHCTNNPQWFATQSHHDWFWWQNTAGFKTLEDFWNRDLLSSNGASALIADANTTDRKPLGLSEFCNGNFISEHAPYSEFFNIHGKHWFQYPSLANTTQPKLNPNNMAGSVNTTELENHKEGNRLRIRKTGAGIVVTNHSALNYLAVKNTPKLGNSQMQVTLTMHDDKVLQEYHDILLPRAVEYSAGILDYFFRGTFAFGVSGDDSQSSITVYNTSSQDFYDGAFYVLIDADGVRTLVQSNHLDGLLPSGGSTSFTCNYAATNKYLLFYQGTIGWTNGAALDPVDAGNAVAIAVPPLITVTANPLWTDSGLTVSAGQTLTISASGTWSWASGEWTDADGTIISNPDVFLSGANQGSLTAYVGTHPPYEDDTGANRWGDASYFPRPTGNGYWLAGKRATITTDRTGELWFLFNDDATGQYIDDNAGTLEVRVTINN